MNQFFYKEGENWNSFNPDKVIRTVTMEDKSLLVLLDDIHERAVETPTINTKTNRVTGVTRKRDVFQSEILLRGEDIERFRKATDILALYENISSSKPAEVNETV